MTLTNNPSAEDIRRNNEGVLLNCKEGDLLQFPRAGGYAHWGVYAGNGKVIHRTGNDNDSSGSLRPLSSKSPSGVALDKAEIREDSFWDVVGDSLVRINNYWDKKKAALSGPEIVKRARQKLGEVGYNALWNNCEHFATWCRYGKGVSLQAIRTAVAFGLFPPLIIVGGITLMVMAIKWSFAENNSQRRLLYQESSEDENVNELSQGEIDSDHPEN